MKFLDLHIDGFGKFHDRDLTFADGLNILYGKNEAGKSTVHTFIRCMLFGLERGRGRASRTDLYSQYEPWDNRSVFGGRLRLEQNGTVYRIERNFQKDQKSLTLVNETLGKEVEPTRALMDQLLCGLSETAYTNTISIGQLKSATDGGMVAELHNYIANMNTTGNMSLNASRAASYLRNKRKEMDRQLQPDASREYTALLSEIRAIEKEIAAPEYENQLQTYQDRRSHLHRQITEKQQERETLLQKIAAGRQAMASARFTDGASVERYRDETRETYEAYEARRIACEGSSRRVFLVLCVIAAILSGAATAFLALGGMQFLVNTGIRSLTLSVPVQPLAFLTGFLALAFAVIAAALSVTGRRDRREMEYAEKLLQEVFSRHLGDSSISEEAIEAFITRMNEYIRLDQVLVRSEASLREQEAALKALQTQETDCDDSISRQQKTQWELEKKLDHLAQCKDRAEALRQVLEENDRLREEIEAIDLALDTITELSSTIRDSFGYHLNKTASDMIRQITGGIYDSMSVDENLNLFMNTRTKLVPARQVSSGTLDQIYLALRLAAARLIQSGHDSMPLIFDDSFVLYDEERLRAALRWLATSYQGQILIFTCHSREAQMMTANQIPYTMVKI